LPGITDKRAKEAKDVADIDKKVIISMKAGDGIIISTVSILKTRTKLSRD
jgi:hypothetical protein